MSSGSSSSSSSSSSSASSSSTTTTATTTTAVVHTFSRGCSYSEELIASILNEVTLLLAPSTEVDKGKKKFVEPVITNQWVSEVLAFSSEYNLTTWSARTVVGAPKVYPQYGDIHGAWAQGSVGSETEYLVLKYEKPVIIKSVHIYETNSPGAVCRISALANSGIGQSTSTSTGAPGSTPAAPPITFGGLTFTAPLTITNSIPTGDWVQLWEGPTTIGQITQSRIFAPELHRQDVASDTIRVDLNCRGSTTWCEIDCVQLVGDAMVDEAAMELAIAERKALAKINSSSVGEALGELLRSGEFSDVTFVVQGKELKAHRNILSVRCSVFHSMFAHDTLENRSSRVSIPDVNYEAFSRLIQFLYTGTVNVDASVISWLYFAADKYGVEQVRKNCIDEFRFALTVDNVVPVYELIADLFPELKEVCMKFMVTFASELASGSSLELLSPAHLLEVTKAFASGLKKK